MTLAMVLSLGCGEPKGDTGPAVDSDPGDDTARVDTADTSGPDSSGDTSVPDDTADTAETGETGGIDTGDTGVTWCEPAVGDYTYVEIVQDETVAESCGNVEILQPFGYLTGYSLAASGDGGWELSMAGFSSSVPCVSDSECVLDCELLEGQAGLNSLGLEANLGYSIDTTAWSTGAVTMSGRTVARFDCIGAESACQTLEAVGGTQLPCTADFTWTAQQ